MLCYAKSFYSLFFNKLPLKFSILEVISENDLMLKSEKEISDVDLWLLVPERLWERLLETLLILQNLVELIQINKWLMQSKQTLQYVCANRPIEAYGSHFLATSLGHRVSVKTKQLNPVSMTFFSFIDLSGSFAIGVTQTK